MMRFLDNAMEMYSIRTLNVLSLQNIALETVMVILMDNENASSEHPMFCM